MLVEETLRTASQRGLMREPGSVEEALAVDDGARIMARELVPEIAAKTV